MKKIHICNNYWSDQYKIIKDYGNGFLTIELNIPIPYKNDFPQRWMAGNKLYLINDE